MCLQKNQNELIYICLQLLQNIFFAFIEAIGAKHKTHIILLHCEQRTLKTPPISLLQRSQYQGTIVIAIEDLFRRLVVLDIFHSERWNLPAE
jgi:hypothetical protein